MVKGLEIVAILVLLVLGTRALSVAKTLYDLRKGYGWAEGGEPRFQIPMVSWTTENRLTGWKTQSKVYAYSPRALCAQFGLALTCFLIAGLLGLHILR